MCCPRYVSAAAERVSRPFAVPALVGGEAARGLGHAVPAPAVRRAPAVPLAQLVAVAAGAVVVVVVGGGGLAAGAASGGGVGLGGEALRRGVVGQLGQH